MSRTLPLAMPPIRRNQSSPSSTPPTATVALPTPGDSLGGPGPLGRPRSRTIEERSGEESERNFPNGGTEDATETRVYPVRRVVHMKPLEVAEPLDSDSYDSEHSRPSSGFDSRLTSFSLPVSTNSNFANPSSLDGRSENDSFDERPPLSKRASSNSYPLTTRFSHTVTVDGSNLVVTGRDGKLERCEDEPIHAPGAVQAYGVLICFDQATDGSGNFKVAQVSENSTRLLGLSPSQLFNATSLTDLLSDVAAEDLLDAISLLDERDTEEGNTDFMPFGFDMEGDNWSAFCAVHRPSRTTKPLRLVLEFDMKTDPASSPSPPAHSTPSPIPGPSSDAAADPNAPEVDNRPGMASDERYDPSVDELLQSTKSFPPLKDLIKMKRKRDRDVLAGRADASTSWTKEQDLQIFSLISTINERLGKAEDLTSLYDISASIFREITEYDRAMVYRFDEQYNGKVVAENVDWTRTKDLFRGLHFPSGDIPAQARELYKMEKTRTLFDRDATTARMVCRDISEVNDPLDMSHAFLRALSPIHVQYLSNLGVRSTFTCSLVIGGELFGMIVLHGYRAHRVTFPIRSLCRLLGDTIGKNIERLEYKQRFLARKFVNTTPTADSAKGYIAATAEDLLQLFNADFGCLSINEEAKLLGVGETESTQELLALLEYLRQNSSPVVRLTQNINRDYPDIDYKFVTLAGFFSVPLSREGKDFIVFCRKGMLEHIRWAGSKSSLTGATLEPRKSFAVFSETVQGQCASWNDVQEDTPQVLLLIFGRFIDVWRQKESLLSATRLTNLLLTEASVSVRTPLTLILSYLEQALGSEKLDADSREKISQSFQASRTLVTVINDLLDLTRTEQGQDLALYDPFDLPSTIQAGALGVERESALRGISFEIVESPQGTPATLLGDSAKVARLISELCSNAYRHTKSGGAILIEWGELPDIDATDGEAKKDSIRIGVSVSDSGCGISAERLERMFREFEHISTISDGEMPTREDESAVGLGLALVARIVKNFNGQLRVESNLGKGSKFTFVLPFRLPAAPARSRVISREPSVTAPTPPSVQLPSSPAPNANPLERSGIDQILESLLDSGSQAFSTRGRSASSSSSTGSPMSGKPFNRISATGMGVQSLPVTLAPTRTVSRGPLSSPLRKTSSDAMIGSTTIGVEALKLLHDDPPSSTDAVE